MQLGEKSNDELLISFCVVKLGVNSFLLLMILFLYVEGIRMPL